MDHDIEANNIIEQIRQAKTSSEIDNIAIQSKSILKQISTGKNAVRATHIINAGKYYRSQISGNQWKAEAQR